MRTDITGRAFIMGVLAELASGKRIKHSTFKKFVETIKYLNEFENESKCGEWNDKFYELLQNVYGKLNDKDINDRYRNDAFFCVREVESGKMLCVTNSIEFADDFNDNCSVLELEIVVKDYDTALGIIREDDGVIRRFY